MNEGRSAVRAPAWFSIAALGAMLWEILGCGLFVMQLVTDAATLPRDQQAILVATPEWMNIAWGFAVVSGLAGAALMLMRNRRAEPLLLLSFLAVLVQFSGLLIVPELRNLTNSNDLLMPFVVAVVCYGIWHLARLARKSGWLA
jgi:hypothetical protein